MEQKKEKEKLVFQEAVSLNVADIIKNGCNLTEVVREQMVPYSEGGEVIREFMDNYYDEADAFFNSYEEYIPMYVTADESTISVNAEETEYWCEKGIVVVNVDCEFGYEKAISDFEIDCAVDRDTMTDID